MKEESTYNEENITCPKCKKVVNGDSWEIHSDNGEDKCHHCGAEFSWTRDISVTYSSELKQ